MVGAVIGLMVVEYGLVVGFGTTAQATEQARHELELVNPDAVFYGYPVAAVPELEREAFVSLCGEPKSQERMQHMLMNNKPLRN